VKSVVKYVPRVLQYLRPHWGRALAAFLVTVAVSAVGLLAPWPMSFLVDSVLGNHPAPHFMMRLVGASPDSRYWMLYLAVFAGLAVALTGDVLDVINNYLQTKLDQDMILDFRSDLFRHAQRLSVAYHDQKRSGMIIYIINSMGDAAIGLIMKIPYLLRSVATLVGMFWVSMRLDPKLALLSLTVVPFLYYSVGYYSTHIQKRLREVKGQEGESLAIIHEAISMIRVILAFGRQDHEYNRFRAQARQAVDSRIKITVRQTVFTMAVNATTAAGTALVMLVGARHVLQGRLTVGELLAVLFYVGAVYKPLEAISYAIGDLQDGLINLQIAFDLLDTRPDIQDAPSATPLRRVRGAVQFEDVQFSYAERVDTLRDVSFESEPGQVVAIVGPTGAGKSTLVSLLPRFYDPAGGRVLIDGVDIRNVTLESLRDKMSIVLQEPLLFSGTIADNIRYGRLDATEQDVIAAAKAANAHEFIMRLPEQYQTPLGERGAKVSGGERQRIAVARAFLKDAPILILDEPTSSIDSKTEAVILDALDRLMEGRTTFMIAHRLSTIRRADLILVMDKGRIVERGTHEELIRQGGLYEQLHRMQSGTAAADARDVGTLEPSELAAG